MKVNVLSFGQVADIINTSSFNMSNVADIDTLKQLLEDKFPQLKEINYAIAVDKKVATGNVVLQDKSVVALLPPFSGG
jgi:molybdopterin synthase sulfur carrier subunit